MRNIQVMQVSEDLVDDYIKGLGPAGDVLRSMAAIENYAPIERKASKLRMALERALPQESAPNINDDIIFVLGFCKSDVRFYLIDHYEELKEGFTAELLGFSLGIIQEGRGDIRGALSVRDSITALARAKILGRILNPVRIDAITAALGEINAN